MTKNNIYEATYFSLLLIFLYKPKKVTFKFLAKNDKEAILKIKNSEIYFLRNFIKLEKVINDQNKTTINI